MFCQFQKTAYYVYFGTMREKNVMSVPKNGVLRLFWDYEGKKRSVSSKKDCELLFFGTTREKLVRKVPPKSIIFGIFPSVFRITSQAVSATLQ